MVPSVVMRLCRDPDRKKDAADEQAAGAIWSPWFCDDWDGLVLLLWRLGLLGISLVHRYATNKGLDMDDSAAAAAAAASSLCSDTST